MDLFFWKRVEPVWPSPVVRQYSLFPVREIPKARKWFAIGIHPKYEVGEES